MKSIERNPKHIQHESEPLYSHSIELNGKALIVDLYYAGTKGSRVQLGYRVTHGNEAIFHNVGFSPSPMMCPDSEESVMALLGFLSCRPGDTDPEFFDVYTDRQLEWAEENGEELSLIVSDYEEAQANRIAL
jgi:hypothetical protein